MLEKSIKIRFKLMIEWKDHRLEFHNIKSEPGGNILRSSELEKIWTPTIIFENTDGKAETRVDENSQIMIMKTGNFTLSNLGIMEEFKSFKGTENSLLMIESYFKTIKCDFNLEMFPFDIQVGTDQ